MAVERGGAGPFPVEAPSRGVVWLRWAGLAVVATLAVAQLASPFSGDQALFTLIGEQLRAGDALYADVWDVKQPVLYLWYSGATWLFWPDEVGVHLAEAVWLLGFAALLPRLLRGHVRTARAAALAPLLAFGSYYLVAEPLDRTQAEVLAGPLLFLACWFGVTSDGSDRRRLVLAGVFVGLSVLVKVTMAPMAAAGLLVVLVTGPLRGGGWWRRGGPIVGWSLLGFALVAAVVSLWLAATGGLADFGELVFEYLPGSSGRNGRVLNTLRLTFTRFALMYLPLGLLALAACTRLLPSCWPDRLGPPRLLLAMATWAVLMVPLTIAQNGWKYLPQVAVIPLAVLAADGVEVVRGWSPAWRRSVVAAVAVGVVAMLVLAAQPWGYLLRHGFGVDADDRRALGAEHELAYQRGAALRDAVPIDDVPGDLFVVGNPLGNLVTDRPLATRIHVWSPAQLRQEEWDDLLTDLQDDDPPAVVVVSDPFRLALEQDQPAVLGAIEHGWCEVGGYGTDTWYVRPDLLDLVASGGAHAGPEERC